ncbi:MAG: UPF0280 family protein [Pseudomonadota bacterium]
MERPAARTLPDGRLHLTHGPIDLIITAEGEARDAAHHAATARFATILPELCQELPALRRTGAPLSGSVARQMARAVSPHQKRTFVTPMAAVAGAVADEILNAMAPAGLTRAIVNNGGDIALYLAPNATARARIAHHDGTSAGTVTLRAGDGVGGIATSGRHGRSLSRGIADSVTVLAASAAEADVAATLIANAVDLPGHPAITRVFAETLDPDSDLAGKEVTTGCGPLAPHDVEQALSTGARTADAMLRDGLILGAALFLAGEALTVGRAHQAARVKEHPAP